MRPDMDKLICERQRRGSRMLSLKTGARLNPNVDYDDDYDTGPVFLPNGRRRMYGWNSKELNENLNPLFRYLDASAGRPWDEVYSEIRANIDTRSAIGLHVMQHLYQHVEQHVRMVDGVPYRTKYGSGSQVDGLYIHPETGILSYHYSSTAWRKSHRYQQPDTDKYHWYGNVWFERTKLMKSVCRCTSPAPADVPRSRFSMVQEPATPPKCVHHNPLDVFYVWFVVEYDYHAPDDVYQVLWYETATDYKRIQYNLEPGGKYVIRYRDVPEKNQLYVKRRKVANKRELKVVRALQSAR